MLISIVTPTFNRAYILPQCYESLKQQSCPNFEWIIVDDGSTDNTELVVKQFLEENKVPITYIKQQNGGKHRAHNTAVKAAKGKLCVCVDSDDALSPDAIEVVERVWTKELSPEMIGILALRGDFKKHQAICSGIPAGLHASTMSDLRDIYGFSGDTVLFFRTDILKQNPFREFSGEKFLTENNLYCELDKYGKMILLNQVLYYCEYLPDGLTAQYHKILLENPKGTADTYYKMALTSKSKVVAFKYAIIAQAYKSISKKTNELNFVQKKWLFWLAWFGVPVFKLKYFRKFQEE